MKLKSVSTKKLIVVFTVLLAVSVGLFALVLALPRSSVVYLVTGDIYFGSFRLLPFPSLENAWVLQRSSTGDVTLNPVNATIWKPSGAMRINPKQIVFWATLSPESAVMRAIKSGGNAVAIPTLTPQPTSSK